MSDMGNLIDEIDVRDGDDSTKLASNSLGSLGMLDRSTWSQVNSSNLPALQGQGSLPFGRV